MTFLFIKQKLIAWNNVLECMLFSNLCRATWKAHFEIKKKRTKYNFLKWNTILPIYSTQFEKKRPMGFVWINQYGINTSRNFFIHE